MPISKCKFPLIEHTTDLSCANSIHTNSEWSSQSGISNSDTYFTCNSCVINIQHLYMTKYKYTISKVTVSALEFTDGLDH